jgi:hypothetical protein
MIRELPAPKGRLFVVQVAFLTRHGWTDAYVVRVTARGLAGAVWRGMRQARRTHLKRGTHVRQTRILAIAA